MPRHKHAWRTSLYLLLSLPDVHGFGERVTRWSCTCGQFVIVDGTVRVGTPLFTPEYWDTLRHQEQRTNTPEAQEARRQMHRKVSR